MESKSTIEDQLRRALRAQSNTIEVLLAILRKERIDVYVADYGKSSDTSLVLLKPYGGWYGNCKNIKHTDLKAAVAHYVIDGKLPADVALVHSDGTTYIVPKSVLISPCYYCNSLGCKGDCSAAASGICYE